jgi:hypothetical protein
MVPRLPERRRADTGFGLCGTHQPWRGGRSRHRPGGCPQPGVRQWPTHSRLRTVKNAALIRCRRMILGNNLSSAIIPSRRIRVCLRCTQGTCRRKTGQRLLPRPGRGRPLRPPDTLGQVEAACQPDPGSQHPMMTPSGIRPLHPRARIASARRVSPRSCGCPRDIGFRHHDGDRWRHA